MNFILSNWEFLAAGAYMVLEFWMGRTAKISAGSVLELVLKILTLWRSKSPKP